MKKSKKWDGVTMPRGKCLVAAADNCEFKGQIDRLCESDRKEVANFRRTLRKLGEKRNDSKANKN